MHLLPSPARISLFAVAATFLATATHAQQTPSAPDLAAVIRENTHPFTLTAERTITGAGAEFLTKATADSQFVVFGEGHHDRDTPLLASAIYRLLRKEHRYEHAVVELDPLGTEMMLEPAMRGDARRMAEALRRYPTAVGFASDQDLQFLIDVATATPGKTAIWGIEQVQSATLHLEQLEKLAPDTRRKQAVAAVLAEAREKESDRTKMGEFLFKDATILSRLEELQKTFAAKPGSKAEALLTGLVKSAEIYSYYRRSDAGEFVGLYNNTVREEWLKRGFLERYRAVAKGGKHPKAFFKFGSWHMLRGRNPGGAWTISNLAHEFAIANGKEAYGVDVVAFGGYTAYADAPPWLRPLLPSTAPETPVLLDLKPLRPLARFFTEQVEEKHRQRLRDEIHGFEALVVLPNSAKASWDLTGFPVP